MAFENIDPRTGQTRVTPLAPHGGYRQEPNYNPIPTNTVGAVPMGFPNRPNYFPGQMIDKPAIQPLPIKTTMPVGDRWHPPMAIRTDEMPSKGVSNQPFATPSFSPLKARNVASPKYQDKNISLNQALQPYGQSNSFWGALMNLGLAKGDMGQAERSGKALNDFNISNSLNERQNADRELEASRANMVGRRDYSELAMKGALQPLQMEHLKQQVSQGEQGHLLEKEKVGALAGLTPEQKRGYLFGTAKDDGDEKFFHGALAETLKGLQAGTLQQENVPPALAAFLASKGLMPPPPKPEPKKGWFN